MRRALLAAAGALAGCGEPGGDPVPTLVEPAYLSPDALPVMLRDASNGAMEARISGQLVRRGPCLLLKTGGPDALVLWADKVTIRSDKTGGWRLVHTENGQHLRDQDWIVAGGGHYPPGAPAQQFAATAIPYPCAAYPAVQIYAAERASPPAETEGQPPPNASPPAPDELSLLDPGSGQGTVTEIRGVSSPREALFRHVVVQRRRQHAEPLCLADVPPKMLTRLRKEFAAIYHHSQCSWRDGSAVVLAETGAPASFVTASIICEGRLCRAEGATISGNLGGEGRYYLLTRRHRTWRIQNTDRSWMS